MDLPTYLSTIPDRPMKLKDACPHCGATELVGLYEASTNSIGVATCENCHYNEETGCAGAWCGSDDCQKQRVT